MKMKKKSKRTRKRDKSYREEKRKTEFLEKEEFQQLSVFNYPFFLIVLQCNSNSSRSINEERKLRNKMVFSEKSLTKPWRKILCFFGEYGFCVGNEWESDMSTTALTFHAPFFLLFLHFPHIIIKPFFSPVNQCIFLLGTSEITQRTRTTQTTSPAWSWILVSASYNSVPAGICTFSNTAVTWKCKKWLSFSNSPC